MAKSDEKRLMLFKIESTEGTDPSPVVGTDPIITRNFNPRGLNAQTFTRDIDGQYFGARENIYTSITRPFSFEVEMVGSGAANTPPNWMKLLRVCGFDAGVPGGSSVLQSLISADVPSATIYGFLDDLRMIGSGVRGSASLTIEDDAIPFFAFNMVGIPPAALASDTTPGSPTFPSTTAAPVVANTANTSFSLDSFAAPLRRLNIDFGAQIELRSLIGPSDTMAYRNREITGTALIELPDITSQNYYEHINGAKVPMAVQHGTAAGNIIDIDSSTVEIGAVTLAEEQGKVMANVPLRFIPTVAGNDELTITTS